MSKEPYGLLFGGETRSAFGIGVYHALAEKDLPVGCAIGAAFGAYSAALICAGNLKAAQLFWEDGLADRLIRLNNVVAEKSLGAWMTLSHSAFRRAYLRFLFDENKTLCEALAACIPEDAVRRSQIRFGLSTVNEKTLMPVSWMIDDIPRGKLARLLMISATIPVYRQDPEGFNYLEHGLYERMPARLAGKQPVTNWIGADLSEKGLAIKARKKGKDLTIVTPPEAGTGTGADAYRLGELCTLRTLGYLQGTDYYLDPATKHRFFDALIRTLGRPGTETDTARLTARAKLLGLDAHAEKIDVLTAMMLLLSKTKYQKAPNKVLAFLEITARTLGIPKLKSRPVDGLISEILTAFSEKDNPKAARLKQIITAAMTDDDANDATPEERLSAVTLFAIAQTAASLRQTT